MEWLVTGTITYRTWKRRKDGTLPGLVVRHFPSFVILDPGNVRSEAAVRRLAWNMIGSPLVCTFTVEERIQPPCDECVRRDKAYEDYVEDEMFEREMAEEAEWERRGQWGD